MPVCPYGGSIPCGNNYPPFSKRANRGKSARFGRGFDAGRRAWYNGGETCEEYEVYEAYQAYEAHEAYEAYEDRAPKADGAYRAADTQGKRGKKALRMTMAFSEENMDYIRTMGKLESGGATAYVNRLIEADRRKHADVYRQMKSLRPDA